MGGFGEEEVDAQEVVGGLGGGYFDLKGGGGWVGWVEAVRMSYCGCEGRWVGGWVGGKEVSERRRSTPRRFCRRLGRRVL